MEKKLGALARLRIKVRQGLARRFLIMEGSTMEMPFERIRGRIDAKGVAAPLGHQGAVE